MSTLEEEIVRPLKEQLRRHPFISATPLRLRWWHQFLIGLLIFALSIGVCGIFQLKTTWGKTWQSALQGFQWLVFVKGDALAVDEVGRYLKQLEGVRDVVYQSPEDALQRFRDEKLAAPLDTLGSNPFPPAWRVTWQSSAIGSTRMQEQFQDTVALPGVADVAYSSALIEQLRTYRLQWLQAKWILSALMLCGAVLFTMVAGVLLTRLPFPLGRRKRLIASLLGDVFFWSAGFGLVFISLGALPWGLLAGGVVAAVLRWMFVEMLRLS